MEHLKGLFGPTRGMHTGVHMTQIVGNRASEQQDIEIVLRSTVAYDVFQQGRRELIKPQRQL
jgi:hypothetical protein